MQRPDPGSLLEDGRHAQRGGEESRGVDGVAAGPGDHDLVDLPRAHGAPHRGQLGRRAGRQRLPVDGQGGQDPASRPGGSRSHRAAGRVRRLERGPGQAEAHPLHGLPQHRLGRARDGEGNRQQHVVSRSRARHGA